MAPPPAPSSAFAALGIASSKVNQQSNAGPPPADVIEGIRQALVQYPKLSKIGLVEAVSSATKNPKSRVKTWVDALVERSGKAGDKKLVLKA